MRKILKGNFPVIVLLAFLLLSACNTKNEGVDIDSVAKYTCPMHPEIVKDEPGACPICGMDLVPVNSVGADAGINDTLARLIKPTNELVISEIKTVYPSPGTRSRDVNVKGLINYNTNNQNSVSSRVSGRIEKLYIKYNYQAVSKGQKLMDIYSPDLADAQQELLFLKSNNEPVLLEQAKKKLRLLGFTEQQINHVLSTGKVDYTVSIYSPYSGYVSEPQTVQSSAGSASAGSTLITSESSAGSSSAMGGMSGSGTGPKPQTPDVTSNAPLQLREGQYLAAGQRMFNLVNSNQVWAEFYVTPGDLDKFKRGTMIDVQSIDMSTKRSRVPVSLIQPYYNDGTNYSLVRATLSNTDKTWKVGELITVQSEINRTSGTWLPRTAVLQLGRRFVSFIKRNGAFLPVYVDVKGVSGQWVDIGSSLDSKKEVALNAWFLVDSESFINVQHLNEQ
ncbi:MAG: efflux RND transporter periplasmic adaptor subunit [Daejeonella sp.]|uniref:efflux RND transporter periplasmic adaptor subunit n=1 Tax=Daejeonella sp. JGW-45 TaxID=3034148 RepID=UPI0023ED5440|nr:efflux RND transporter periplasmic adaptor subunit [Daejeonella sp. JGW-45]